MHSSVNSWPGDIKVVYFCHCAVCLKCSPQSESGGLALTAIALTIMLQSCIESIITNCATCKITHTLTLEESYNPQQVRGVLVHKLARIPTLA